MTLSKKLRFNEDLGFPIYKKGFRTLMEKDMYFRAIGLEIQNEVLRTWNPFRTLYQIEHPMKEKEAKPKGDVNGKRR